MALIHDKHWQAEDGSAKTAGYCKSLVALLLFVTACSTAAQTSAQPPAQLPAQNSVPTAAPTSAQSKAVLLVQRIDDVLYGVDPISLALVDAHHVSGVLVRVNASLSGNVSRPSPPLSYSHFVADCRLPLRLATLATASTPFDLTPQGASARARLASANAALGGSAFIKTNMLDVSRSTAEFACATSQRPARAVQIAKDLFENGGPSDMRTALCDLQPNGANQTREDVSVRFSDSEKVVSVNNQWMGTGTVTDTEISFGSGPARWRIDRNTAEASLVNAAGKVMFMGSCVARTKP